MPKQVDIKVVPGETHRGGGFRKGDYVVYGAKSGHVSHVELKVKWAFINTTEGERFKVPLDSEVLVTRSEPTDEEKSSERMDDFTKRHLRSINIAKKTVRDQLLNLTEVPLQRINEGVPFALSVDVMLNLAAREAEWYWWAQVEDRMATYMDRYSIAKPQALLWAIEEVKEMATEHVVYRYNHRVLSRSTSVASNLQDDLIREAAANFIDDFRYDHLEELMEQYPNTIRNNNKEK